MNIALALVVMTFVLNPLGAEAPAYEEQPAVIGSVTADSPAARAGLQKGDRIVAVAGKPVATWEQLFLTVMPRAEREIPVEFERAGRGKHADHPGGADQVPDGRHRRRARDASADP